MELLESAYQTSLVYDLRKLGLNSKQEVGYEIGLIVKNKALIEIKSIETLTL